jgi:5-methylcytosine-specific restriction endonuclease McrA
MPILRSGYAANRRNGSTRAHRTARAQTLNEEPVCAICGLPGTHDDPLEAGHIIPHAYGGPTTRANMRAEHRSHNRARGALSTFKGGGV